MRIFTLGRLLLILLASLIPACATLRTPYQISFITQPCIIPVKNFTYTTCAPFIVKVDGNTYTVPGGFNTDLASIPRVFWNILPPQRADFVGPAILHDYMYDTMVTSRLEADDILYWNLRAQGAMWITANTIWVGVRLGGAKHFGPNDHDDD